ncbi:MAG: ArsR/SmtB family transcription factor [Haloarculaceae archaeon]
MSLLPTQGPETRTSQDGELEVVGIDGEASEVFEVLASETARSVLNAIYRDPGTPSEIADRLDMSIQKVSYHLENLEDADLISVAGTRYSEKGQEMKVYEPPADPKVVFIGTRERKRSLVALLKRLAPGIGVLGLGSLVVDRLAGRGPFSPTAQSTPSTYETGGEGGASGAGAAGGSAPTGTGTNAPAVSDGGGNVSIMSGGEASGNGTSVHATRTATPARTETAAHTPTGVHTSTPMGTHTSTPAGTPQPAQTPTPVHTPTPVDSTTPLQTTSSVHTATQSGGHEFAATATPHAANGGDLALDTAAKHASSLSPGLAFFLGGLFVLALVVAYWAYSR